MTGHQKRVSGYRIMASAVSGCLILAFAGPVSAQQSGADDGIDEVVVTARKREENLIDVPVSISVLNSELLREAGIVRQQDLFEMTVGLEYDVNFGDRNSGRSPCAVSRDRVNPSKSSVLS